MRHPVDGETVCAGSLMAAGENGSGVKTNRVTPIIYLDITFTPSYYKQSKSLLHKRRQKILWHFLGQNLPGIDHGLLFIYLFIYFSATNISRVAK